VKFRHQIGRYELKYLLPTSRREEVLELAAPHVRPDPHSKPINGGLIGYEVHTLYLDTPGLDDYFERLERRKVRNRLRVRTYGRADEAHPVFLENKRKSGKWVVKHRVPVCDSATWCGFEDPRPWSDLAQRVEGPGEYAASSFCQLVDGGGRHPVSVVHYEREVYVPHEHDDRHIRLSLDHKVRATVNPTADQLFAAPQVDLIPPDWMVMELKFLSSAPRWMGELCRELQVHAIPVSKFGLSIARGVRGNQQELRLLTPRPLLGRAGAEA